MFGEGVASTYAGLRVAILTLLTGPSCAAIAVPLCVVWSCLMRPPLEVRLSRGVGPSSSIQLRFDWPAALRTRWTLGPPAGMPQVTFVDAKQQRLAWNCRPVALASRWSVFFRRPEVAAASRSRQWLQVVANT
jgi:hypothetical protein